MDVFGRHARTHEGKLQVELAQHQYLLPRLVGQWSHLERLGGGIGTRGPGETQLETDRRLIRRHIQRIQAELDKVRERRSIYIGRRKKASIPMASLVGYTNAGKSTLFNALCNAGRGSGKPTVSPPWTRSPAESGCPSGDELLLTDTVGFIQKLSPMVVAAFRATLEELAESDILLHVLDITHPKAPGTGRSSGGDPGRPGVEPKAPPAGDKQDGPAGRPGSGRAPLPPARDCSPTQRARFGGQGVEPGPACWRK